MEIQLKMKVSDVELILDSPACPTWPLEKQEALAVALERLQKELLRAVESRAGFKTTRPTGKGPRRICGGG